MKQSGKRYSGLSKIQCKNCTETILRHGLAAVYIIPSVTDKNNIMEYRGMTKRKPKERTNEHKADIKFYAQSTALST